MLIIRRYLVKLLDKNYNHADLQITPKHQIQTTALSNKSAKCSLSSWRNFDNATNFAACEITVPVATLPPSRSCDATILHVSGWFFLSYAHHTGAINPASLLSQWCQPQSKQYQNVIKHNTPLKNMRCSLLHSGLLWGRFQDLFGVPTWHEARPPAPWMEPGRGRRGRRGRRKRAWCGAKL